MIIVITMAGVGSRFRKAGYDCPKYMIKAKGKTLFDWSMDSLKDYNPHVSRYIFVVRKEDNARNFIVERCKRMGICNVDIIELDYLTDGQATSCYLALNNCAPDESIMVYNIDTYVEPYELKYADIKGDGHIPCFNASGDNWSFVRLNGGGLVAEVREKNRISNNCTLGAYYFSSVELYKTLYNEYYSDNSHLEKNEKYIAPLYNCMIQKGLDVTISIIDSNKVHVLGTPKELSAFINSQYE